MNINQVLAKFRDTDHKIKLHFVITGSSCDKILNLDQNAINPTFIEIDYQFSTSLEDQLLKENLTIDKILGLVYKYQDPKTNDLELFFLTKSKPNKPDLKDTNWLNLETVKNNYTGLTNQIAALYAFGYLNFVRDHEETDFYPTE